MTKAPLSYLFLRGVDNEILKSYLTSRTFKTKQEDLVYFLLFAPTLDDIIISWNKISGITTDGAQSGLSTLICNKVSQEGGKAVKLHCIFHQQVPCAKRLNMSML